MGWPAAHAEFGLWPPLACLPNKLHDYKRQVLKEKKSHDLCELCGETKSQKVPWAKQKGEKQSVRANNGRHSSKGWRRFGQNKPFKTNHLLVYKHPHSSISKTPSTIGYQSVGHPALELKKPNRLWWTRTKKCKYIFTQWTFVVLGDEPVQTTNMGHQNIWFQASLFMTS